MKKLLVVLCTIFVCTFAIAQTISIDWKVDGNTYAQNTCDYGGTLTVPTQPTKYGYTFQGWAPYIQLEYIESTGTQYIDTGYIPNNNTRMEILYKVTAVTHLGCGAIPIGGRVAYMNKHFSIFSPVNNLTDNVISFASDKYSIYDFESVNKEITGIIDIPNNYVALKTQDNEYSSHPSIKHVEYEQPLYLFLLNTNGSPGCLGKGAHIQIMYVKLSENGVMIHDFIPVLTSAGVPCMYDKVTSQFFYNQGTGDFIAGPVLTE